MKPLMNEHLVPLWYIFVGFSLMAVGFLLIFECKNEGLWLFSFLTFINVIVGVVLWK
jgi:hypothetical protein